MIIEPCAQWLRDHWKLENFALLQTYILIADDGSTNTNATSDPDTVLN